MNKSSANLGGKITKGEETRAVILKAALRHASVSGYDALTIGVLAEQTGMSKSGLFAHFGSKEELQIATLDEAVRRFNEAAFMPALSAPRGLKRLIALFDNWLAWTERADLAACPMMVASTEFDDKEGAMRDAVVEHMQRLQQAMVKSVEMAVQTNEFAADTDAEQFAFELFGIISTCYRSRSLFRDKDANIRAKRAFDRLLSSALMQKVADKKISRIVKPKPRAKSSVAK
jgi:AcrR family transcriptional regulator